MKKAYVKPTMVKMEVEVQSFMAASKGCVFIPKNDGVCFKPNEIKGGAGVDFTLAEITKKGDNCLSALKRSGMFTTGYGNVTVTETSRDRYKVCKKR